MTSVSSGGRLDLALIGEGTWPSSPGEITGFKYLMIWHPRVNTDAAHAWLRGEIRRIGKAIGS
jgi:hypothetical protein